MCIAWSGWVRLLLLRRREREGERKRRRRRGSGETRLASSSSSSSLPFALFSRLFHGISGCWCGAAGPPVLQRGGGVEGVPGPHGSRGPFHK